ncbi:MAG: hypothetical protein F9B45_20725 [Phycisphaera sp. RhM]|nr:hypothetical protein [Phycisphaera sp. RhM]
MDQSLSLTGEQRAFINSSSPDGLIGGHSTNGTATGARENGNSAKTDGLDTPDADAPGRLNEPRIRRRTESPAFVPTVVLSPLTTRLRPDTSNALKRAYLERKLAGIVPNTQQEIVEAALDAWLVAHGYLTPQIADQN